MKATLFELALNELLDADRLQKGGDWNAATTNIYRKHSFMRLRFDSMPPFKSTIETERCATKTADNIAHEEAPTRQLFQSEGLL